MWTHFMDIYSGGGLKEAPYNHLFIEAPKDEAVVIFYNRFGHNPNRISCTCCGEDYSISEYSTLEQATAYERGLRYAQAPKLSNGRYDNARSYYLEPGEVVSDEFKTNRFGVGEHGGEGITLDAYMAQGSIAPLSFSKGQPPLILHHDDILNQERAGAVPRQGWIWLEDE